MNPPSLCELRRAGLTPVAADVSPRISLPEARSAPTHVGGYGSRAQGAIKIRRNLSMNHSAGPRALARFAVRPTRALEGPTRRGDLARLSGLKSALRGGSRSQLTCASRCSLPMNLEECPFTPSLSPACAAEAVLAALAFSGAAGGARSRRRSASAWRRPAGERVP